ncbi:hypothetical protein [Bordetella genomosp. 9]|uniref:DUF551 domain-containing protein n=1 Tax=Bordetella genomosp. 9 TaxID=1416803 RepID=A0A1W6YYT0_9BORD|nr:hypothetical protein [Bordetella genomosp. 9]ARP86265.1 hypothetical protein CAL13_08685 [Bordetella genomosp. 9]
MTTQNHTTSPSPEKLLAIARHLTEDSDGIEQSLCDEVAAWLEKVAAQPQQPAGWRDIETAPRDGTPLMLFARHINAEASTRVVGYWLDQTGWIAQCYMGQTHARLVPSLWQPLPPFPGAHPSQQEDDVRDAALRERVRDAIAAAIGGSAYDCGRVWSAWSVGTMGEDDFFPIVDQDERLDEITDAAIAAMSDSAGEGGKNGN